MQHDVDTGEIENAVEPERGFAGTTQVWARMNATALATGDHLRAWISAFTGSTSTNTSEAEVSWNVST